MSPEEIVIILGKLEAIDSKVEQVHGALYGNGDPHKGIIAIQAKMDAKLDVAASACDTNAEAVSHLSKGIGELGLSVKEHHKQTHMADYIKKPKTWGYILLMFVATSAVIDLFNPWILALVKAWTGIGIPVP
jgi:hypothetical protein